MLHREPASCIMMGQRSWDKRPWARAGGGLITTGKHRVADRMV